MIANTSTCLSELYRILQGGVPKNTPRAATPSALLSHGSFPSAFNVRVKEVTGERGQGYKPRVISVPYMGNPEGNEKLMMVLSCESRY